MGKGLQISGFSARNVQQVKLYLGRLGGRRVAFALHHQRAVVRADRPREVAHALMVQQHLDGARGDVDGGEHLAAVCFRKRFGHACVDGLAVGTHHGFGLAQRTADAGRQVAKRERRAGIHGGRFAGLLRLARLHGEEPRLCGTEVSIPVAYGVARVQNGGNFFILAGLAAFFVVVLVRGTGQDLGIDEGRVCVLRGHDGTDPAGPGVHHAGFSSVRGEQP
ncbi:hypothetical protein PJL18_04370 [Paenarthrobacter nicotinovorans]|nr:hypothetical protein [Paenarthrobacter nicotinovorans]